TADLQDGPSGLPVGTVTIPSTVPTLNNVAAARISGGLRIQVTGYSPERRITNAEFGFDVKTPTGKQRVTLVRKVEADFEAWYRNASSSAFGSSFVFEQLFNVQGDTSAIDSVTVNLTNGQGAASSSAVKITGN